MSATGVNVLLYRSKTLANGEHPLMLCVTKERRRKYVSMGISLAARYWDFDKSRPKRNCPNRIYIEKYIADKQREYTDKVIELTCEEKAFTANTLVEKVCGGYTTKTVGQLFTEQIEALIAAKRTGYALSVRQAYTSLMRFNGHLNIYFSEIDVTWLKRYETWLRSAGLADNTIGIRFRSLRMLYNLAIEQKIVKAEYYPFRSFKVSRLHQQTAKRAIRKDDILRIVHYSTNDERVQLAVDLFAFSYYMGGINFVDMCYLTEKNIIDNRLVYIRKKTKKLIKLPLQTEALKILARYNGVSLPYLFPVLSSFHKTETQQHNRVHKVIAKVNIRLKKIGEELNLPLDITTYVARHSFATVLKRSGVSTSLICETLGHSSEKVTQIYLDSFENSQIDAAMQNLL